MINAISSNMFVTPPTTSNNSVGSVLQVAVDNTSVITSVASESGFTEQGLALLALMALLDTEDNPLNLTQRMLLLTLLLSMTEQNQTININNFNMSALDGSIPAVGYTSTGGAVMQSAPVGALYSASV